jgi:hypothetical protein
MRLQALIILVIFFIGITEAIAQENSDSSKPKWILNSYFESFIAFKGNATKRAKISDFQYNHNRYNIPNGNPLIGSGISFNLDYSPTPSMLVKAEWRKLSATKQVYLNENGFANGTSYVTLSFSYRLSRSL